MTQARGFTLVELMVAITGGLFLSIVVFSLSKQSTQFYQQEMRVAAATNGAVVGFERLRSDIARAGYLSSPNIRRDPRVCGDPVGDPGWPTALRQLASITVEPNGFAMPSTIAAQVSPSQITISGALSTIEAFPMSSVFDDGVNYIVSLQPRSAALVRIGYTPGMPAADQLALLGSVFGVGRGLRIVQNGKTYYGSIVGVNASNGTQEPFIRLSHTPLIAFKATSPFPTCGIDGQGKDGVANPINIVRYDIRTLDTDPNYATIYGASASETFDTDIGAYRTELARVELDTTGAVIAGTRELIAEYAVDLQFGLTFVNSVLNGTDPTLASLPPGHANVGLWAGPTPSLAANQGPELVRAVRTRLSIRSREADRSGAVTATSTVAPGLYRIRLGTVGGRPAFARVRTLQADIGLRNQTEVYW